MALKLYRQDGCPFCNKAEKLLGSHGFDYRSIDIQSLNGMVAAAEDVVRVTPTLVGEDSELRCEGWEEIEGWAEDE